MSTKERRHSPRTTSSIPLDLYDPDGRVIVGEGRFINLSTTGGQMESPKPFQLDEHLRLRVQSVAGRSPLELAGRIIWARRGKSNFTYGIQFDDESSGSKSSH